MPSGSWTNESHGLIFSGGRWHVFFQKNANGPYMSRLHWGHLSSADLCSWREEPIAIYPGEPFDIKGCWSGCVYEDGDDTYILYTAVDNEKARIVQAKAKDNTLVEWGDKQIVIDGRPAGLSDDFRDPYYFEANGNKYIIVGSSKNHVGACTLHQLKNGSWTNDGAIFFQGSTAALHGTFWEMPNVTPLGNGKFLFTCTPLGTQQGVRTLCWVGTIGTDGKFTPDASGMQYLEMGGISRDGYGLLSPSICRQGDKTLLLGIVPDKLPTDENFRMGWAHNYSLPRELSVAADGSLVQQPYSGLAAMRKTESLSGRQLELLGEFTVGSSPCGIHFLRNGSQQATLSYDPATGILSLDYSTLDRVSTDAGQWSAALPKKVVAGQKLTLHVFLDGSVVDIFVNNTWAFSERIFPTAYGTTDATSFGEGTLSGWTLDASQTTAVSNILRDCEAITNHRCYNLQGQLVSDSYRGVVICNGKKICR
jgi:beta-fructofuranosidase